MGEVYLARDSTLHRSVALKFLPDALESDETARQRFLFEARSAAALDHPYICKIYEIGELDGRSYIAMEYVVGETLGERIARGPIEPQEAIHLAIEIIEALEVAHAAGIVHRDLKPENIMVTESGHVKVMDFGLAKRVAAGEDASQRATIERLTATGSIMGTPAYMSPEQLRVGHIDARSDTFSLGVILYEMLTGVHPFLKDAMVETIASILGDDAPPPSSLRDGIGAKLDQVVGRMMARKPGDRYASVVDVRYELAAQRRHSHSKGAEGEPSPPADNRPRTIAVIGIVMTLVVVASSLWWWTSGRSPLPRGPSTQVADSISVAVLPFENLGAPDESSYALGVGETMAIALRGVDAIDVPPSASVRVVFGDGTRLPQVVGRELGVDYVLTGSVQFFEEDTIRVYLDLVDVESGNVTWDESFDRDYQELSGLLDEIALAAVDELQVELAGEARAQLLAHQTDDVVAWEMYWTGAERFLNAATVQDMSDALLYFDRAIAEDEEFPDAHIGKAAVLVARVEAGGGSHEDLDIAREHYSVALELDGGALRAYRGLMGLEYWTKADYGEAILGWAERAAPHMEDDDVEALLTKLVAAALGAWDAEATRQLVREALAVDSVHPEIYYWATGGQWGYDPDLQRYAETSLRLHGLSQDVLLYQAYDFHVRGEIDQALRVYERALALEEDPVFGAVDLSPGFYVFGGIALDQDDRREEAEAVWSRGVDRLNERLLEAPQAPRLRSHLAALHGLLGDRSAMESEADTRSENLYMGSAVLAAVYARLGDVERAAELLRDGRRDPLFDEYRMALGKDPRDVPELRLVLDRNTDLFRRLRRQYGHVYRLDADR